MSGISIHRRIPYSLITNGAVIAEATGTGSNDIVFPDLIGVVDSRIGNLIMVGPSNYRRTGTNPEISAYDPLTGTFTCVDPVDVDIPCMAFYRPV